MDHGARHLRVGRLANVDARARRRRQARFIGRPQQIFWAIATLPHFGHRNPAMELDVGAPYNRSRIVAMP